MEGKLEQLINFLNSSDDTLKFTSEYSGTVHLLDVQVAMGKGESWQQIYSASQLIHISSCIGNLVIHGTPRR